MSKPELTVIEGGLAQPAEAPTAEMLPEQGEMPFAVVEGEPITQMPRDLYIPPDALQVFLEAFEGPLDLLLYLIRRQNLDIVDIPIAEITRQYLQYIDVMTEMQLELAGEYLLMAATLAEIKSRMLLPRPQGEGGPEEDDPRAELVRRLQEYERFKKAAQDIDTLPRQDRDTVPVQAFVPERTSIRLPPPVELREMLLALHDVFKRAELYTQHAIKRDALSVRQRMGELLERMSDGAFHRFESLFTAEEGKLGVVVTFLGLLTLAKEQLVEIVQDQPAATLQVQTQGQPPATIYVKSLATNADPAEIELSSEFDDDAANDDVAS